MTGLDHRKTRRMIWNYADRVAGMTNNGDDVFMRLLREDIAGEIRQHPANQISVIPDGVDEDELKKRLHVLPGFHARLLVIDYLIERLTQHREAHQRVIDQDRERGIECWWAPTTLADLDPETVSLSDVVGILAHPEDVEHWPCTCCGGCACDHHGGETHRDKRWCQICVGRGHHEEDE